MRKNEELSASSPGTPILPAAQRWQLRLPIYSVPMLSTLFLISALSQPQPPNRPTRASTPAKPVTPVVAEAPRAAPYTVEAIRGLDPPRLPKGYPREATAAVPPELPEKRPVGPLRVLIRRTESGHPPGTLVTTRDVGRAPGACTWDGNAAPESAQMPVCIPRTGMPSGTLWNAFLIDWFVSAAYGHAFTPHRSYGRSACLVAPSFLFA